MRAFLSCFIFAVLLLPGFGLAQNATQNADIAPPTSASPPPAAIVPTTEAVRQPCLHALADERLANHCLLNALQNQGAVALSQVLLVDRRLQFEGYAGLGLTLPPQITPPPVDNFSVSRSIGPTVEYSTDINGGNSDQPLQIGFLTFAVSPPFQESGILLGGEAYISGRWVHGGGRYVNFAGGGGYAHSFDHDIGIERTRGQICSINHIKNWWYGDVCFADSREWKELTHSINYQGSFALSKTFAGRTFPSQDGQPARITSHQAGIRIARNVEKGGFGQRQTTFFLDSIHARHPVAGGNPLDANSVVTGISLTQGEKKENILATRSRLALEAGWWVNGKSLSLFASYSKARGARLFGIPRDERTRSISISYPVHRLISVSLGYTETDSKIDYFDSASPSINFRLTPVRF